MRQAVWQKIAAALQEDIREGKFAPAGRLPTEAELAARFAVNRHTVRQAVGHLSDLGLVVSHQGRGVFLRDAGLEYRVGPRTRLTDNLLRQGHRPQREEMTAEIVTAPRPVARALRLVTETSVWRITYRTRIDGKLVTLSEHFFPKARFPTLGPDFLRLGSVTEALRAGGLADYVRAQTRITARLATPTEARALGLPRGRPLIVTWGTDCDPLNRPISVNHARMVADSVTLTVERDE